MGHLAELLRERRFQPGHGPLANEWIVRARN